MGQDTENMKGADVVGSEAGGNEARLLEIIGNLVKEIHGPAAGPVRMDSVFDRDLALDSLARVELMLRIERAFAVRLPESALGEADSGRALLAVVAVAAKEEGVQAEPGLMTVAGPSKGGAPTQAATLVEVLEWHVTAEPDRVHIHLYAGDEVPIALTYQALYQQAQGIAAGLRARGVAPGEAVALMLPTSREFLVAFLGILVAGAVPAPLYPPVRRAAAESHLRRQAVILNNCRAPILITQPEICAHALAIQGLASSLRALVTVDDLGATSGVGGGERPRLTGSDLALLQYTSGSTGDPKGVMLTHDNLLANVRAMGQAVEVNDSDVFVSWLPLYHDMGLIGAWLGSLYHGLPLVLMPPLTFLARPARWLRAIHRHRGTLSAGPNFAYELCATKITDEDVAGLDLSSWRVAFNGAEQVSPQTLRRFTARFAPYGLRTNTLTPVYGLAESSVGLAFPPLGREPVIDCVGRENLTGRGIAAPLAQTGGSADTVCFVACGRALPGHALRIVDERDRPCEDRREGRVQFRGPSACLGYYRNPEATARLQHGEWLDSGDRGYMVGGELYITGRVKDIIIRGGHNIYPYEIEAAVGALAGVREGGVAAFASRDVAMGTERLVVLAETRETRDAQRELLRAAINETVIEVIGNPPDEVVLAPPRTVLKTSSGKVRRDATRQRYEKGDAEDAAPPLSRQLGLAAAGAGAMMRRGLSHTTGAVFAIYVWVVFLCGAVIAVAGVAVLPTLSIRQRWCQATARALAALAGIRLDVGGRTHFAGPGIRIVVANHASYIDALILVAALPCGLHYVTKQELATRPVLGWCLRRIGCEFVERFDTRQSAAAADRLEEKVRAGHSLVFFPEGTFGVAPGLRPFRMGAFVAAARSGVEVVPVALRGTRAVLPSGSWRPRRGTVSVNIAAPLRASGTDWRAAVTLRDQVRAAILLDCGEPELIAM